MSGRREELRIEPFRAELRDHFLRLNTAWLLEHFVVEPEDERVLANPERTILDHGGRIFFAFLGEEVIGTCGLEREAEGVYAVIKMTVDRSHRGLGVGRALLQRTIEEFHALGGKQLFLETNSALIPALHIYETMGFVRQPAPRANTAFVRSDVYMVYEPQRQ
jgi:putative acetyltransferase